MGTSETITDTCPSKLTLMKHLSVVLFQDLKHLKEKVICLPWCDAQ